MKYEKCILLVLCVSGFISCDPPRKEITSWSEEFNYTGLPDSTKWSYEEGKLRNNEEQYYRKASLANSRVEDGHLVIEAVKDTLGYGKFTSASLITKGKHSFLYGRVEVRAKLPVGKGTWPAIWLLGENIDKVDWPACGELDIMENVGFDSTKIHANIHTEAFNHVKNTNKGNNIVLKDVWDEFHVYSMDWKEDKISFAVDDSVYFTYEKLPDYGNAEWPFDKPHFLILNLAIGGAWGGKFGVDEARFPHKFEIDYVRYTAP